MKKPISKRRHVQTDGDLNLTPVMNIFMVLIPFLLLTAVFAKTAVIDIYLPRTSSEGVAASAPSEILSVTLTDDGFKLGGLGRNAPFVPKKNGNYDFASLSESLLKLKENYPDKNEVVLLFPQNAPYEIVIKLMDSTRETYVADGDRKARKVLFPLVSVGEAPVKGGS